MERLFGLMELFKLAEREEKVAVAVDEQSGDLPF